MSKRKSSIIISKGKSFIIISKRKRPIVFETISDNFSEPKPITPTSNNDKGENPHTPERPNNRTRTCPNAPEKSVAFTSVEMDILSSISRRLDFFTEDAEKENKNLYKQEKQNNTFRFDSFTVKNGKTSKQAKKGILLPISRRLNFSTEDAEKQNNTFGFHRFTLRNGKTREQAKKGNIIFSSK